MQYFIGGLLIFVGILNLNLIRVAVFTGKIQSRMFPFDRYSEPSKYWLAISIQGLVSALLFALGIVRFLEVA